MKVDIYRSSQYLIEARVSSGENVPERIRVEVLPIDLPEELRRGILALNRNEYPDCFSPAVSLDTEAAGATAEALAPLMMALVGQAMEKMAREAADQARAVAEQRAKEAERAAKAAKSAQATEVLGARFLAGESLAAKLESDNSVYFSGWKPDDDGNPVSADGVGLRLTRGNRMYEACRNLVEEKAKARAQEIEARRTEQLAAWVQAFGTDEQKRRFARGVLPVEEIVSVARDFVFAPLADLERYVRIKEVDVIDSYEAAGIDTGGLGDLAVVFQQDDVEHLTAAQFALVERIEAAMPGATVKIVAHEGFMQETSREQDAQGRVVRYSAFVVVDVGDGAYTFSRQYKAD